MKDTEKVNVSEETNVESPTNRCTETGCHELCITFKIKQRIT